MDKAVASSNGRSVLYMNSGKMNNQGFEGNLSVQIIRNKTWNWNFNVNFGRNTSEVTLANDDIYSEQEVLDKMLAGNLAGCRRRTVILCFTEKKGNCGTMENLL